ISPIAYRMSALTLDFLRTIPALVLVPLVALLYGAGIQSVVVLAFLAAVWAVIMQAIYGVHDVDPVARETFRSLRVRKIDYVRLLLLPSAAPYLSTGIRLAAAVCLLVSISAQIVIPLVALEKPFSLPNSAAPYLRCMHISSYADSWELPLTQLFERWNAEPSTGILRTERRGQSEKRNSLDTSTNSTSSVAIPSVVDQ